ncbi:hypothetical protein [Nonomuraea rhizosphaerae]|uniref:hypothetical protein n=1 Tax=Nonomuraea rhizosphaerae TaxID=2665663 RepID=UPI001C5D43E7|nr:hypothetical protein [Nonomuraea rhizosphaerae]
MMATQQQIDAARRRIEQLRDQHEGDVTTLIRIVESGALKGPAGDKLSADLRGWERAFNDLFVHALSLVDSVSAEDPKGSG